jgi:hypothetical protein
VNDTAKARKSENLSQATLTGLRFKGKAADLFSPVPDSPIERADKVKGRIGNTVGHNHSTPCDIGEATCTGNEGVSTLNVPVVSYSPSISSPFAATSLKCPETATAEPGAAGGRTRKELNGLI